MAVTGLKRQDLTGTKVRILSGQGTPVDGTSGTGVGRAVPGSIYVDTTASMGRVYRNEGTKASPVWTPVGRVIPIHSLGRNGAGSLTLTGAKVGDRVAGVYNISTPGNAGASFETEITVADAIQQSSASNLSAVNLLFFLQR